MEDDIDIYDDLPIFETKQNENVVENNDKDIPYEQIELKKQIAELTIKLEDFQRVNKNLEVNLMSLLKTAKAEIARKEMVINDLRRKLDDATFKRGVYSKGKDGAVRNSALRNAATNNRYESTGSCSSSEEKKFQPLDVDFLHDRIKEESTSTLAHVTVFGQRLHKRIVDEQNLEKKNKLSSENNSNNNVSNNNGSTEGTERYVGESDKENGSSGSTNFYEVNNVQPPAAVQCIEKDCTKNPLSVSRIGKTHSDLGDKSYTDTKLEQIAVAGLKHIGKRSREETDRQISVKRIKCEDEKHFAESKTRENSYITHDILEETADALEYRRIEGSVNLSKRRPILKASDTGYTCKSTSIRRKQDDYIIVKEEQGEEMEEYLCKKNERKRSKKETDEVYNTRAVNRCFSKRENKCSGDFLSKSDERYVSSDRCLESLKRVNHRSNVEERRSRRYAVSTVDRRSSRVKDTTSDAKCHEEKYGNSQHVKDSTCYGGRFEKRYDHRGVGRDKSNAVGNEFCGIRNVKKSASIDRKTNGLKISSRYEEYECRKLRTGKPKEEKQIEYNEREPHRRLGVGRSRERAKDCTTSTRNEKKTNCSVAVGQGEGIGETNSKQVQPTKGRVSSESKKHADEPEDSLSSDLEEGEIENSPEKQNRERKRSEEVRKGESHRTKVPLNEEEVVEQRFASINSDVRNTRLIRVNRAEATSDPGNGRRANESMEIVENVENIENIEKFIREQASDDRNVDGKTSEPAHETETVALENANLSEKTLTMLEDVRNGSNVIDKGISENRDAEVFSKLVGGSEQVCEREHEQGTEKEKEKEKAKEEKGSLEESANKCSSISERENFLGKDDRVEAETSESKEEKVCLTGTTTSTFNFVALPNEGCSSSNATNKEQGSKVDYRPSADIAKDDLLLVLGSKSPFRCSPTVVGSLSSGSSRKTASNEEQTAIDSGVKGNDDTARNRYQHRVADRDDNNETGIDPNDLADGVRNTDNRRSNTTVVANLFNDTTKSDQMEQINGRNSMVKEETEEAAKNEIMEPERSPIGKSKDPCTKAASSNVHGKIVVFVRRKKPVRLVDSNANMTVLINSKKHEVNAVDSSFDRITSNPTLRCTNSSFNKTRTSDRETKKAS